MFKHRSYRKSDLKTICSFPQDDEELFFFYPKARYPLTPEQLQYAIEQRSDSIVIENNDIVIGFANFYHWEDGVCKIGNLIVAPVERGKGAAKYLIEIMIDLAQSKHAASEVNIACFSHNTTGLLLYTKLGFKPFRIEERLTQNDIRTALIHMQYEVSKPNK